VRVPVHRARDCRSRVILYPSAHLFCAMMLVTIGVLDGTPIAGVLAGLYFYWFTKALRRYTERYW